MWALVLAWFILPGDSGDPKNQKAVLRQVASEEVDLLIRTSDFQQLRKKVNAWKKQDKVMQKHLISQLASRLDSTKPLKLENYADLIVWSRLQGGKMKFHGHGYVLKQDVFLENGRCAWAIEELLKIELPTFTENMAAKELTRTVREAHLVIIEAMNVP